MKESDLYVITSCKMAVAKTGSPYAVIGVRNLEDSATVHIWGTKKQIEVGTLVSFLAFKESDGFYSATLTNIRILGKVNEGNPLYSLLKRPVSQVAWDSLVLEFPEMAPAKSEWLISKYKALYTLYVKYPAASGNHHAFVGGLAEHTHQMMVLALSILKVYPFTVDSFTVLAGVMFHDFGKTKEYLSDGSVTGSMHLLGHHFIGASMVTNLMTKSEVFTTREIDMVAHAILAHHGRREWGSPVVPATQEAFLVHHIDMLSGHGQMFEDAKNMERVSNLDTTIIKL